MFPPSLLGISQGWGLIDLPLARPVALSSLVLCSAKQGSEELLTAAIERGPSNSSIFPEGAGKPSFTARIERPPFHRGGSASKKGGCLPPRILLKPRVARAQEIIRLHPLFCSASKKGTWPLSRIFPSHAHKPKKSAAKRFG